jgi:hypothetical protein
MNLITGQNVFDLILAFGAIAFAIGQFNLSRKSTKANDIESENSAMSLLQRQVATFKDTIKELTAKVETMGKEISALQAVNLVIEKDKEKYLAILQNRNPEFEKFMGDISGTMVDIKNFMKQINDHMEKEIVVTSTVNK